MSRSAGPLPPQDRRNARRAGSEAHPVLSRVLQLCLSQVRPADHRDVLLRERPPHEYRCGSRRDGGQAGPEVVVYEEGRARGQGSRAERRGQLPRQNPRGHQVRASGADCRAISDLASMSTDPDSRGGFGPYLDGVGPTFHDNGEIRTIRYGVIEDLEHALDLNGKHVAAFLVEPIQGEAG